MAGDEANDVVLGIDLGGTDLKAALVDREGRLEGFHKRPSRTLESREAPYRAIVDAVEALRDAAPRAPVALGLGSPGAIDAREGRLVGRTAHLPHWSSEPLAETLAQRLGLPVRVDNDANLAALAEHRLGAARASRVALVVTLGTGIGCGIVVDGRVVRGAHGGAGELGHLPFGDGARPCACGVEGCIEPEASAGGLLARARDEGLDVSDAAGVFAAAARGDARANALVDRTSDRLAAVLATGIHLLDPDRVVLGGGLAEAGEPLFARVREALARYTLASHRERVTIVPAALGERAGTVGAGLLAWESIRAETAS